MAAMRSRGLSDPFRALIIALTLILGAIGLMAQDDGSYSPAFEETACFFSVPPGQRPTCGYVMVPEDRDNPGGPLIRLATAVFHSSSDNPAPDPLIYLSGGPGGSNLEDQQNAFNPIWAPYLAARDVIIFDQRGSGLSHPSLACVEYQRNYVAELRSNPTINAPDPVQAVVDCATRLVGEGVTLSAYTSAANARDVDDLRRALGYDQVNLFGVSYGSRLALTVMRDAPEGVRSVILGATYPPDVNLFTDQAYYVERVFNLLFETCAANPGCAANYPDLEDVFFDLVADLDADPVQLTTIDLKTGDSIDVYVDGNRFISVIFQAMYASELVPYVPQYIYDFREGVYASFSLLQAAAILNESSVSRGMYFSIQCNEELSFVDPSTAKISGNMPGFANYYDFLDDLFLMCAFWNSGAAENRENEPVSSDIPSLLIAGSFDPITPPEWARNAAETLSSDFYFEFPTLSHDASLTSACARDLIMRFLDDPLTTPDATCLDPGDVVEFIGAGASSEQPLIPFVDEALGVGGLVPDGWISGGNGVFSRNRDAFDTAIVQIQLSDAPPSQALSGVIAQFGVDTPAESMTLAANGISWRFYTLETGDDFDRIIDLALGAANGRTIIVALFSPPRERETLYETVLVPVVESIAQIDG